MVLFESYYFHSNFGEAADVYCNNYDNHSNTEQQHLICNVKYNIIESRAVRASAGENVLFEVSNHVELT